MSSPDVVEVVAARLEAQLQGSRTVYRRAVPAAPDTAYVVVRSSVGETSALNLAESSDLRTPTVWVTSVSRASDPATAARESSWGSQRAVEALVDWRPPLGQAAWTTQHVASQPTQRDDSLPDVVFYGVDQFSLPYQP